MNELTPTIPDLNSAEKSSTNSYNSNSKSNSDNLNSVEHKKRGGARKGAGRPRKNSKQEQMSPEDVVSILEKQIQDPSTSPRDRNASIRKLALLQKWEQPYDRRPVAQRQPPEPLKPLAPPPQPDDSTSEEREVLAKAQQSWRDWSKQYPRESADFLLQDLHNKYHCYPNLDSPESQARIRLAAAKWTECWAEYDALRARQEATEGNLATEKP